MKQKLNTILLIDDDKAVNFIHRHIINKAAIANTIVTMLNGQTALNYLTTKQDGKYPQPELIFLDINMPVMDGWEFLKEFKKINYSKKSKIIIMLTTSINPAERERATNTALISDFKHKPLTVEMLEGIMETYF